MSKNSSLQDIRFHFMAHEVMLSLSITAFNFIIAWFIPEILHFFIIAELSFLFLIMHPAMIGFDIKAFERSFVPTVLRGLLLGFCYGNLQNDIQISFLQAFNIFLPLLSIMFFCLGFFSEFMRRRGFSDWINVICTSLILCMFVYLLLGEIPGLIHGILFFSSIALSISIRLQTKNVWDAILTLLFLYIISSNAASLFHLFVIVR
ncbi:MAG: hypothetical protein ACO34C_08180 [Candidatus Kapaibacteriota bacterium]